MIDDNTKKIEQAKICIATARKLHSQITALKYLSPDGVEGQYLDTAFAHAEKIQGCLKALLQKAQEKIGDKDQEPRRRNSGSIKP